MRKVIFITTITLIIFLAGVVAGLGYASWYTLNPPPIEYIPAGHVIS